MNVYRIEHPNDASGGPWQTGAVFRYDGHPRVNGDHSAYDPPGPRSYGEHGTALYALFNECRASYGDFYFGFRSKTQLVRWFKSKAGRQAMQEGGSAVLRVYEVDPQHVVAGNWQIAFRHSAAKPIATLDLATLKTAGEC
ncbi:hypothetical protein [Mesorhizobium sp. M0296]|uniref:hypothetical protein n=1 Tax=Mesorhizobium sp. M0296 TaxID=2956931 RepID=UPI00333A1619